MGLAGQPKMKVTVQLTADDVELGVRFLEAEQVPESRQRNSLWLSVPSLGIVLACVAIGLSLPRGYDPAAAGLRNAFVLLVVSLVGLVILVELLQRRARRTVGALRDPYEVEIADEGLVLRSRTDHSVYFWPSVKQIVDRQGYAYYLLIESHRLTPVPYAAFDSDDSRLAFIENLRTHVQTKGSSGVGAALTVVPSPARQTRISRFMVGAPAFLGLLLGLGLGILVPSMQSSWLTNKQPSQMSEARNASRFVGQLADRLASHAPLEGAVVENDLTRTRDMRDQLVSSDAKVRLTPLVLGLEDIALTLKDAESSEGLSKYHRNIGAHDIADMQIRSATDLRSKARLLASQLAERIRQAPGTVAAAASTPPQLNPSRQPDEIATRCGANKLTRNAFMISTHLGKIFLALATAALFAGCATLPPPEQMKAEVATFQLPKLPPPTACPVKEVYDNLPAGVRRSNNPSSSKTEKPTSTRPE